MKMGLHAPTTMPTLTSVLPLQLLGADPPQQATACGALPNHLHLWLVAHLNVARRWLVPCT